MSELHKALLEVQKDIKPVKKTSDNLFFHSKYADLEAVVEAVMPILSKHGVVCVQTTGMSEDGRPHLVTALVHAETGEKVESKFPIISKDNADPQKVIAGLTYMRRASITTICGLATQDDDGNTASGNSDKDKQFKTPQPKSYASPAPKTAPKEEPIGKAVVGILKKISPTSILKDTSTGVFKVKTEKDGDFFTEKEILAQLCKQYIGKSLEVRMTVDGNMRNVILDISGAVPF